MATNIDVYTPMPEAEQAPSATYPQQPTVPGTSGPQYQPPATPPPAAMMKAYAQKLGQEPDVKAMKGKMGQTPAAKAAAAKAKDAQQAAALTKNIQSMFPGMSAQQANQLWQRYQFQQKNPGFAQFAQQQENQPNPLAMQMFYNKTVVPYLQGIQGQYQQALGNEQSAVGGLLKNSPMPAAERQALQGTLPLMTNPASGLAQLGSVAATPMYDQMITALQNQQSAQQALAAEQARVGGYYEYMADPSRLLAGTAATSVGSGGTATSSPIPGYHLDPTTQQLVPN